MSFDILSPLVVSKPFGMGGPEVSSIVYIASRYIDPGVQGRLRDPAVNALFANPGVQGAFVDPAVESEFSQPGVQSNE